MSRTKIPTDKVLLSWYMKGFSDYLDGNMKLFTEYSMVKMAYDLGGLSAKAGDDVSSIDMQSDKEILKTIKTQYHENKK